jgi:hypothetical protein
MNSLLARCYCHRYPACQWARQIGCILRRIQVTDETTLIDAPCGDGIISYRLMLSGVGNRYELCDTSERAVARARAMFTKRFVGRREVSIQVRDIFDMPLGNRHDDVWLLVNSLFLLPDIPTLVRRMRARVKHVVGVFPHTNTADYRSYLARRPDVNTFPMNQQETIEFFAGQGYTLLESQQTSYVGLRFIRSGYIRLLASYAVNPLERFFPRTQAQYWIGAFVRDNDFTTATSADLATD